MLRNQSKQRLLNLKLSCALNFIFSQRLSAVRRQLEGHRRQIGELRCFEQKWQRQVDTIGEAVTALGGQVPLGCEQHLTHEAVSSSVSLDELTVSNSFTRTACSHCTLHDFCMTARFVIHRKQCFAGEAQGSVVSGHL